MSDLQEYLRRRRAQLLQDAANNVAMQDRNPAEVARAAQLASKYSVAPALVEAAPQVFEKQERRDEAEDIFGLNRWLANSMAEDPDRAAMLGKGDLGKIANVGRAFGIKDPDDDYSAIRAPSTNGLFPKVTRQQTVRQRREAAPVSIGQYVMRAPKMVGTAMEEGAAGAAEAVVAGIRAVGDVTGLGENETFKSVLDMELQGIKKMRGDARDPWQETGPIASVQSGLTSAAQTLMLLPATGAKFALGVLSGITAGSAYNKYRDRGGAVGESLLGAGLEGGIEYLTERSPLGILFQKLGKGPAKDWIGSYIKREFGGEQLATLGQDAVDTAIANPDKTWGDYLNERPQAALDTLIATATMVGVMGGANTAMRRINRTARQAQENSEALHGQLIIDETMRQAETAELRKNAPEEFARMIDEGAEQSGSPVRHVFIPVETIDAILQDDTIPDEEKAVLSLYQSQLEEARSTGGDIVMTIGEAAAHLPGTKMFQALREDMRLLAGGKSGREVKASSGKEIEELEAVANELIEEANTLNPVIEAKAKVYNEVRDQMVAAGRGTIEAQHTALLFASRAENLASARYGKFKDAGEAWKWMQLEIKGPDAAPAKTKRGKKVAQEDLQPLQGLPQNIKVDGEVRTFGPFAKGREAAAKVAERLGVEHKPPRTYARVDKTRAERIAAEFDAMPHDPSNPDVKAAYEAMINETIAQYEALLETGLKVEFIEGEDPYGNPRNAIIDVVENNHLWVYPTDAGFGSSELDVSDNPLLQKTKFKISGKPARVNDLFRVVHDYFGHIMEGNGFRADGEENAWRIHSAMYSPLARRAMTTETRGQNSWVNFGPHGEANRKASGADTVYADQKIGLLPEWVSEEGRFDPLVPPPVLYHGTPYDFETFRNNGKAIWFAEDPNLAGSYASARRVRKSGGDRIIPVVADIKNPLYVERGVEHMIEDPVRWARQRFGFDLKKHGWEITGAVDTHTVTRSLAFAQAAREAGYDAIAISEGSGMTWGVLDTGTITSSISPALVLNQSALVGGYEGLSRYLTDEEKQNQREASKKKIMAIAETLPDAEEMAAVALAGRAKRGWYENSAHAILDVFGADAPRFAALLAALSPQTSVESNLFNALKVWTEWNNAGRPTERREIVEVMGRSVMGGKGVGSILNAWLNNSVTALQAKDPAKIQLSGPKVDSFMNNLVGVVDEVTNDAWMANYSAIDQVLFRRDHKGGKGPGYKAMNAVVRKAADILTQRTGEMWTPAEVQETVWSFAKTLYETRDAAGQKQDMAAILAAGRVTHDDIANTPDFAVLFADGIYQTILEEGGYGEQTRSLGSNRRAVGVDGSQSIAALPEGSGFTEDAFRQFLTDAANRLETVRQRRRGVAEDQMGFPFEDVMVSTGDGTQDPMTLQQFGGVFGAIRGGEQLQSRLNTAIKQEQNGAEAADIWDKTGWTRGEDGKWRFEISDEAAKLIDTPSAEVLNYEETTYGIDYLETDPRLQISEEVFVIGKKLGDVLHHPELFKLYPRLRNISVFYDPTLDDKDGGFYFENTIIINPDQPVRNQLSVMLHEVQHAIQEIEGFANGANSAPEALREMGLGQELDDAIDYYRAIQRGEVPGMVFNAALTEEQLIASAAYAVYERVAGEVEARNVQIRQHMTDKQRKARAPWATADFTGEGVILPRPAQKRAASASTNRPTVGPRGEATFFPDGRTVVQLFGKADFSTMLHEMSHVFLQQEFTLAREGGSDELKADIAKLTAWFEKNGGGLDENGMPDVAAHELFARSGERYFREGKAPSAELRGAFKQFAQWLTGIYKTIKDLTAYGPAPITPEISEIFDRMIATTEAIDANATTPMSQEELGMTAAEYEAYLDSVQGARDTAHDTLLDRMMKAIRRRETSRGREQRANVRAEVAAEVNADPRFIALHLLRTGRWLGDAARERVDIKLNTGWLIDNYGEDILKALPVGLQPLHRGDGVVGDDIAQMTGMPSGDALVQALVDLKQQADQLKADNNPRPLRDHIIEERTNEIMAERYGDIAMSEEEIEEEAIAALNSNRQGEILATELRQLRKIRGAAGTVTPYQLLREWARRKVNEGTVQDAVSKSALQRYIRGYNKARNLFEEAILSKDGNEAIKQKQAQMINHALLSEGKVVSEEINRIVRRMQRYARTKALASIDQDYMDRIHELLEGYNFRPVSARARADKASFEAWAEGQREAGHEVYVPERFRDDRKNWQDAQVAKLLELNDMVQSLASQGKLKQRLANARDERELQAELDDAESRILALPDRKLPETSTGDDSSALREIASGLVKMEGVFDLLDGGKDATGPFNRHVMQGATEAANMFSQLMEEIMDPIIAIYRGMSRKQAKRLHDRVTINELTLNVSIHEADARRLGQPLTITRMQLLGLIANTGNLSNMSKLVAGERWGDPESAADMARVRDILVSYASKEDMDLVQSMWNGVAKLWPHIARVERELSGVVPEEVTPVPFDTPYGTYSGGYWPVVWDSSRSAMGKKQGEEAESSLQGIGFTIGTPKGHTITRTDASAPMEWSLERVLFGHLNKVISRVSYAPWVRDALKLVDNPRITGAIDLKLGQEYRKGIKPWIRDQIPSNITDHGGAKWWEKFLNQVRINFSISVLGVSYSTGVAQALGLSYSAGVLGEGSVKDGGKWMATGIAKTLQLAKPGNDGPQAFVFARSQEMQRRAKEVNQEAIDVFNQLKDKDSLYHRAQAMAFWHIGFIDLNMVAIPTWMGGFHKALSQGLNEVEAAAYADKTVRLSQSSGRKKDLSAIQRGNAGQKFIAMFYTPSSVFFNQQWEAVQHIKAGNWSKAAAPTFYFLVMTTLLDAFREGDWPEDDEEDGLGGMDIAEWVGRNLLFGAAYGIPVVRDAANATERKLRGEYAEYGNTPLSALAQSVQSGVRSAIKAVKPEEDIEGKDLKNMVAATGFLFGLPGNQPGKTAGYIYDVATGAAEPESVNDWYQGLTSGKQPETAE